MAATRLTAAKPAVRLGFVYVPNGIIQKAWLPAATGADFEFLSNHEAARTVPQSDGRIEQPDAARRTGARRRRGRSCARGSELAHRHPSQEDRGLGHHSRHFPSIRLPRRNSARPRNWDRSKSDSKSRISPAAAIAGTVARIPTPCPGVLRRRLIRWRSIPARVRASVRRWRQHRYGGAHQAHAGR